ncbi:hypothetical protein OS493_038725 [Desmophyllum pertusum]|uniref:Uncharacterized protein n=1 Tax=Desmophyllum pertusum TaxID=174260 RepID=A0A9X0D022_9CNID|nr:hypothetical protein OS493_038725 [Desmophyllum pertusum]
MSLTMDAYIKNWSIERDEKEKCFFVILNQERRVEFGHVHQMIALSCNQRVKIYLVHKTIVMRVDKFHVTANWLTRRFLEIDLVDSDSFVNRFIELVPSTQLLSAEDDEDLEDEVAVNNCTGQDDGLADGDGDCWKRVDDKDQSPEGRTEKSADDEVERADGRTEKSADDEVERADGRTEKSADDEVERADGRTEKSADDEV